MTVADSVTNNELKQLLWDRQSGLCAISGKKFEDGIQSTDCIFMLVIPSEQGGSEEPDNAVMVWKFALEDNFGLKDHEGNLYYRRYLFPYANFQNYQASDLEADLKLEVEMMTSMSIDDVRKLSGQLKDLAQRVRSAAIEKETKDSLSEKIDAIFEQWKKIREEKKNAFEENAQKNYAEFKPKVDEAVKFATETDDFRSARETLIDLQKSVRKETFARDQRNELSDLLSEAFLSLSARQAAERDNYEMECIENYHHLKPIVEAAVQFATQASRFKDARQKLIDVQNEIKGKKLKRDQRDELYGVIRENFDKVNERQEAERGQFDEIAAENYAKIKPIVDESINFANSTDDFAAARQTLINAQKEIKKMRLKREQMDELYAAIREVFEKINESQSAEREEYEKECIENYNRLKIKAEEALVEVKNTSDFGLIRETLLAVQGEIKFFKLKKDQRNELFAIIREAFTIFDEKRNAYKENRKSQRADKVKELLDSTKAKIERINDSIEKDKISIAELNTDLEKAEEEAKAEIQANIEKLEISIKDKLVSIEHNNKRIEELEQELKSL